MPSPYPNHLISIPHSVVSLKHYFRVHDQGFARTAIYLLILGVVLTALFLGLGLAQYAVEAPKLEAKQAAGLEDKLAAVTFQGSKAQADGEQPRILWEDREATDPAAPEPGPEAAPPPPPRMIVVLDTTGKLDSWQKAADFVGCSEPQRLLLFGAQGIVSYTVPDEKSPRGTHEKHAYTDEAKLAELKTLIEEHGAKLPELKLEKGKAVFSLEGKKVHVLVHAPDLMVLVDTTGTGMDLKGATDAVARDHPEKRPPESLVLLTASSVVLKYRYEKEVRALAFEGQAELSPASVARWTAAAARQARKDTVMEGMGPNLLKMVFFVCFQLFFYALICSVAGLIVSGVLRAGIAYGRLLTMAVYAMTPACLVVPFIVRLCGFVGEWVGALPFVVGMIYTAMAAHRVARSAPGEDLPDM